MVFFLFGFVTLAIIFTVLWRTIASDAYGVRPPPRSHHADLEVDSWGLPTKHTARR